MKKIFSLLMLVACSVCMNAQVMSMYVWKNGSYTVCPVEDVDSITFAVVNAVDLGLPSGTLWADRNVGADAPEAYGDYFAWGEIAPKERYDWSTYKWCNATEFTLTKYCVDSSYGIVDAKTVLELEDDAAYINMGTEWRMPTAEDFDEMSFYCNFEWITQNGVFGQKYTGPNGNSIFFPAAGYYTQDSTIESIDEVVIYWASTLFQRDSRCSDILYGYYDSTRLGGIVSSRYVGRPVRAVVR